jgi:hypothetical protein
VANMAKESNLKEIHALHSMANYHIHGCNDRTTDKRLNYDIYRSNMIKREIEK